MAQQTLVDQELLSTHLSKLNNNFTELYTNKANASDVYTQSETDDLLDLKLDKTYITATPTISSVETESKGGLLLCIDQATGDVAQTSNGWIEDQKYGMYLAKSSSVSAEFDTEVRRTGGKTLKLSTTNTSSRGYVNNYISRASSQGLLFTVKPSTKYKFECYVKTNNVATDAVYASLYNFNGITPGTEVQTNKLSGTNDWTVITATFTTSATTNGLGFQLRNYVTGNVSDAWFDVNSMKLTQLNESTNAGQQSDQPVIGAIVAKSEQRVGRSINTAGGSTFTLPTSEDTTNKPTFTATKYRQYGVRLNVTTKGTSDITMKIYKNTGTLVNTVVVPNASIVVGTNDIVIPYISDLVAGRYFTITATGTTTTPTVVTSTGATQNLVTAYGLYTANTNSAGASAHGKKMELKASSSAGFVDGALWDVDNGKFIYNPTVTVTNLQKVAHSDNGTDLVIKFDTGVPVSNIIANSGKTLQYSTDGSTFTSAIPTDVSVFYIKILSYSGIVTFNVSADLDMSTITVPRCYPTGVVFKEGLEITSTTNITTLTYRANKYQNEDGLVFPALEYGNNHIFLPVDTRDATSAVITAYGSTGTQVGTGSILSDGATVSVTSGKKFFIVLDVNLSKNTTRTWVNDYYADSTRDGSNSAIFWMTQKSQGLERDMRDMQAQIDEIKRSL